MAVPTFVEKIYKLVGRIRRIRRQIVSSRVNAICARLAVLGDGDG